MQSIFQIIGSKIIQMSSSGTVSPGNNPVKSWYGTIRLLSVHYFLDSYISFIIMIINYISQIFHA